MFNTGLNLGPRCDCQNDKLVSDTIVENLDTHVVLFPKWRNFDIDGLTGLRESTGYVVSFRVVVFFVEIESVWFRVRSVDEFDTVIASFLIENATFGNSTVPLNISSCQGLVLECLIATSI